MSNIEVMAGFLNLMHRRNAIAAVVLLVVILTLVIMIMVEPANRNERIIYGTIVCILWLIPSTMYYMLIINYKKLINTDIIPKITVAATSAMRSMTSGKTYNQEEMNIIIDTIVKESIKTGMSKNDHTSGDVPEVCSHATTSLINMHKDDKPLSSTEQLTDRRKAAIAAIARVSVREKLDRDDK